MRCRLAMRLPPARPLQTRMRVFAPAAGEPVDKNVAAATQQEAF